MSNCTDLYKSTLITTHEASEQLGFASATLKDRRILGKLPSYLKVGGRVFYDKYDKQVIQDYLNSCVRTSTKNMEGANDKKQL